MIWLSLGTPISAPLNFNTMSFLALILPFYWLSIICFAISLVARLFIHPEDDRIYYVNYALRASAIVAICLLIVQVIGYNSIL